MLGAYGWLYGLSDDAILARLLVLKVARAARQGEVVADDGEEEK
jgi:hypothetical protein